MRILLAFAATAALFAAGCDTRDREYDGTVPETQDDSRIPEQSPSDQGIDQVRDPVSGVMVDKSTARKFTHNGREYWFASEENLRKFQENPELYLSGDQETPKTPEDRETPKEETPRDETPKDETPKETPRDESDRPMDRPNDR